MSLSGFALAAIVCAQVGRLQIAEGSRQSNYSLTLSSANKMTQAEASAKTFVRDTAAGNPITYVLDNTSYNSNASAFAKVNPGGGYIRNETPVNGIYQISMDRAGIYQWVYYYLFEDKKLEY